MELEDYITQLCQDYQISFYKEGEKFYLTIDEDLTFSLHKQITGIRIKATIATLPEKEEELVTRLLMRANLFGQGTGGGIIGLDKDGEHFTYRYEIPNDLSYKQFGETIEDASNWVKYWQRAISMLGA